MIVRLTLAYDGTGFRGWARNAGQRTVEGVLSDALGRALGSAPVLSVAGRTDAGVHARGQVASFRADDSVDLARLQRSINGMLAPEIVATEARRAPDGFDARFSASAREYRYRIDMGAWPDPFDARFGSICFARRDSRTSNFSMARSPSRAGSLTDPEGPRPRGLMGERVPDKA